MASEPKKPRSGRGVVTGPATPDDECLDALVGKISGLIEGLRAVQAQGAVAYRPIVDTIIRTRCRDISHIERTLDGLLSFAGDDAGLALFKRLCRYYWDIDPHATARQIYAYRDWYEPEAAAVAPPPQEP